MYCGILVRERLGFRGMKSEKNGHKKEENTMFNSYIKDANSEEFELHAKHKIVFDISSTYLGETMKLGELTRPLMSIGIWSIESITDIDIKYFIE
ncbi:hypothetical protein F8M41_017841 [Gigaspora margarita]|uniref:Uncharacterized protein n=1 Tax=Gigaspora margarita TaxID=4874 RepID=A0A8H4AMM4_GIGMA|nr:hypothetical protein F8M41_017841 [Gigaspora margarita]